MEIVKVESVAVSTVRMFERAESRMELTHLIFVILGVAGSLIVTIVGVTVYVVANITQQQAHLESAIGLLEDIKTTSKAELDTLRKQFDKQDAALEEFKNVFYKLFSNHENRLVRLETKVEIGGSTPQIGDNN